MARRRQAAAELDFEPEGPDGMLGGGRQEAWSDTERTIVKASLGSGARRCTDIGLQPAELSDSRARAVWMGALKRIEAGARSVWLDGTLTAEVAKTIPMEEARAAVAWVKGAPDEPDDDAVDALLAGLRDRAFCARVYSLGATLRSAVEAGTPSAAARGSRLIRDLLDADQGRTATSTGPELVHVSEAWDAFVAESSMERAGAAAILGFPTMDDHLRLAPRTFTVIGADTNVGKSTVAAAACLATGLKGVPAALISMEDPWSQLAAKMAAAMGRVNPREVRSKQPTFDLAERIQRAKGKLLNVPVWGCEVSDKKVDTVLAAMRMAASRGCKLIAIDFLQSIDKPSWVHPKTEQHEWIDEILRAIDRTGKERDVTILLTSQFNRSGSPKSIPTRRDLKGSGSIGQWAQNIILLWREEKRLRAVLDKVKDGPGVGTTLDLVVDDFGCFAEKDTEAF